MPASIKLQQQWGDDLQVLFVESQGAERDKYEAFAWRQKWMGNQAMWTDERPVEIEGSGLPAFALLGVDGQVLLKGSPLAMKKQIEEAIAAEIKKAKDAPAGTPAALKKAWGSFAKGDVAAALAECERLATDEAKVAKDEFTARTQRKIARAKWQIDHGYLDAATKLVAGLEKATKGSAELAAAVAEQSARLREPALAKEAEAGNALANLTEKMAKDKPFEDGNVKKLSALAEKYAGTKAAERAAHLAAIAKIK